MSEAAPPIDVDAAMLARLAALDMAAAEFVNARLLAATDTDEINSLGRTYQRVSRGLRQTLALKAKLAREAARAEAEARLQPHKERLQALGDEIEMFRVDARAEDLLDAVQRMAQAAIGDDEQALADVLDRFDVELDDWTMKPDFIDRDLEAQVREACQVLGLPEELAAGWRRLPVMEDLPDPAGLYRDDDADDGTDGPPPGSPYRRMGSG